MSQEPKIKAIVQIFSSKPDIACNSYHYAAVTDTITGATAEGRIDSEGNLYAALRQRWGDGTNYRISREEEVSIRKFNRRIAVMPYMGCLPQDIIAFLQKNGIGVETSPKFATQEGNNR